MKSLIVFVLGIFVVTLISSSLIVVAGPDDEINYSMGDTFIMEVTEFSYTGPQIIYYTGRSDFKIPSALSIEITESDVGKLIYYQIDQLTLETVDSYQSVKIKYSPTPNGLAGRTTNQFRHGQGQTKLSGAYFYLVASSTLLLKNTWAENELNTNSTFTTIEDMISYSIINNDQIFGYSYNLFRYNSDTSIGNFTENVTYEYDKASGVINYIEYDITNSVLGVTAHLLYTRIMLKIDGVITPEIDTGRQNTDKNSEAPYISFNYFGLFVLLIIPLKRRTNKTI